MDTREGADRQRRRTHALAPALLAAACLLALSSLCGSALADGKAYSRSEHSGYRPLEQYEQRAAIVHSDGVEQLVIAISVNLAADEEALWLFPVPGRPERTKIRLVDAFPKFSGRQPFVTAKDHIEEVGIALRATQLYPLIYGALQPAKGAAGGPAVAGVSVHSEIDRWGLHGETLSATSTADLNAYLEERGDGLPAEELDVFEPYLSDEWTLVAAWLESSEELKAEFGARTPRRDTLGERWPCLHVEFPTERAFYPMKVTNSYEETFLSVDLVVAGYMALVGEEEHNAWGETRHFLSWGRPDGADPKFAQALPRGQFWYTTFWTHGVLPEEDVWLRRIPAPDPTYAQFMGNLSSVLFAIPVGVALVAVLSYVAGGLTGLITFQRWRGYAAFGLWNLLTIVGLIAAYAFQRGEWGEKLRKGRIGSGFWRISFSPYWLTFSVLFLGLALAAEWLLLLPLPD